MINYLILIYLLIVSQGILILISKNSVICVLWLIGIFLLSAICFIIVGAEFLGILLLIVYVGAVSILFLFVVMMLNLRLVEVYNVLVNYIPIGSFIGFFFFIELLYMIYHDLAGTTVNLFNYDDFSVSWISEVNTKSNLNLIAEVLYNNYFYLLYFAGFILLVAMIGAIVLTVDVNFRVNRRKIQDSYVITRRLNKRITFWKL